jgi:PAS domain S-box-containing protein
MHHTPHLDAQAMSLFESLPDALVAVDTGWRITALNQRAASLVQQTREEVLGKPLWETFPEALGAACEQHYQQALQTQVTVRFEVWYPSLNRWFQVTASPSHGGLVLFFQEMTRRKHEAEARWWLAALLESSDDAIIGQTLDGIITSWNAGAERLYGYRAEEALGQPIALLAPPERLDEIPRLLDLLKQERRIDQYETERMRKDGTRLAVSTMLSPIKDATGHIIGASSVARDLTERKRIEEALRERDVLMRTLLQHHPNESVTIFDPDLRLLLAEGPGLEAVGLTPQRLVGKTLAELLPPEAVDAVTPYYRRAFAGESVQFEFAFGGHVYTINAAPLPNKEGTIAAIITVAQDITTQKRAEEALRASEHLSQAILDSLTANIAVLNPAGTIIAVNEAWRRFARDNSALGSLLVDTEVGANYLEVCRKARGAFAEEAQEALAGILAVLHGPHPHFTLEYACHSPAEQRWFLMSATPLPAGEGAVVAHLNITERKRAEEAVRASEVRARRLLESNLIGVVVADGEHILEANEAFLEMVGYTREDLDHHRLNWSVMTPAEYAPLDQRGLQELRERGVCTPFEKEYYRKDGSRVPILIGAATLQEQPVQWACFILDISERRELERRKDEFISMASHELKTPITVLKAFSQLIQRRLEKQGMSELVQDLARMQTQLNTLTKLVNELLDVSKIQAGRLDYAQETVNLDALVHEVVEFLQQTTATHTIRLSGASQAQIVGDRDRLSQVFTNLLTNAIKYSPQAKDVDVQIVPAAETVTVSVRDYGVGIPRAHQGKIFERFYRVQDYHDKTFPGLGMGLYISQQIVECHGGKLWVVSEEGQGATFSVTLPLPHTEGAAEARAAMNPR